MLTRRSVVGGLGAGCLALPLPGAWAQPVPADLSYLTPEQRAEAEAMHARVMAAFKYERVTVPGTEAVATWERLRGAGRGWPVIVGGDEELERIADQFTMSDPSVSRVRIPGTELRSTEEILAAAAKLRVPADLRKWSGAYQPEDLRAPVGTWPSPGETPAGDTGPSGPSVVLDMVAGTVRDRVHILLVPARFGWEVPAYLRWGDWNACPPPEYHVAALRDWHDRFGADLVGVNGDTLDLRAANRPKTREAAMALARDQYQYCPDIVDQGVGSITALAAALMASEWWYLWWD